MISNNINPKEIQNNSNNSCYLVNKKMLEIICLVGTKHDLGIPKDVDILCL